MAKIHYAKYISGPSLYETFIYDCPDFLCRKEPGGRRTGKNDYPKKTDILTFMMEQEKGENKRQFHETYPEMARRRNA